MMADQIGPCYEIPVAYSASLNHELQIPLCLYAQLLTGW